MRVLLTFIFLASLCLSAAAQTAPSPTTQDALWTRVELLPPHLSVHISGDTHSATCLIDSVKDTELKCSRPSESGTSQYIFTRPEIQKISTTHRVRSAMYGLAAGAVFGMGYGIAIKKTENGYSDINSDSTGSLMAAGALIFAPIGAGIGALLNLSSHTLYRRHITVNTP